MSRKTQARLPPSIPSIDDLKPMTICKTETVSFLLTELLVRGGQGSVWKAVNLSLEQFAGTLSVDLRGLEKQKPDFYTLAKPPTQQELIKRGVSIRVLKFLANTQETSSLERFCREARCYNKLDGQNPSVPIPMLGGFLPVPWLEMQRFPGRTLKELIQPGIPWHRIYGFTICLLSAVEAMHEEGIVHRDLKPDNIILDKIPGLGILPRILDFGIAKFVATGSGQEITESMGKDLTAMGYSSPLTMGYAPPEQFVAGADIGKTADIFALGVILYELVTGRLPFPAQNIADLLVQMYEPVPEAHHPEFQGEAHSTLNAFFAKVLAPDPAVRPQSVKELRHWLGLVQAARDDQDIPSQ